MKHWTRLLPIALFFGLMAFLIVGLQRDPKILPSELINRQVPDFALPDLVASRGQVSDEDLRGQVHLLNVFGSWCAACEVEHPYLMQISARSDITLIGVNWRDTREAAKGWLDELGDPYERIIFDPDSQLAIDLGVTGAPETFVVDANGRVRYKFVGVITDRVMRDTIDPVLAIIAAEGE
ncbi:MAG: DsbE family thiol:disulfide interchange protein [Alphaproteobacteria bacterium]|nr:DsbE family thiol:disulfide interchange protein [Alphaproteobacteria bacterium]